MSLNESLLKNKSKTFKRHCQKNWDIRRAAKGLKRARIYVNWPLNIESPFVSLWQTGLRPVDLEPIWDASTYLPTRAICGHGDKDGPWGKGMPLLNMTSKSKGKLSALNSLL